MRSTYIIDRFEDGFAILEREDGVFEKVVEELLPYGSQEGMTVTMINGAPLNVHLNEERRARIRELMGEAWQ
jgi:hypothetical protein